MIRKSIFLIFIFELCFIVYGFKYNNRFSYNSGAPPKYTGSPGDGQNCTNCHNGPPTNVTGWITSDIPTAGYTPGITYTITATATDANTNKFGFEISPQLTSGNPLGAMIGTLIITNTTETKLVSTSGTNDNKYISHRAAGTGGVNNSKTWTFKWQAPTTDPKSVTFYGAFTAGSSTSTDHTYLTSYTKSVNLSVLDEKAFAEAIELKVYPNPASRFANISFYHEQKAYTSIKMFDLSGKLVKTFVSKQKFSGYYSDTLYLESFDKGMYFLKVDINKMSCFKKIIID